MRLLAVILCLLFCPSALSANGIPRDGEGKIIRSASVIRQFKATHPCPATGQIQKSCPGYIIDHILPLCAYGPDAIENLQWQTKAESKKKDILENRQCRAIKAAMGACRL